MEELRFDIVIVGMGLGAAAIAHSLRQTAASIVMVPGVGCARFKHLDGGVLSKHQLEAVFGTSKDAPLHTVGNVSSFRRDLIEAWATDQVRPRVNIIDDFADLRVAPHESGGLSLHEESGRRAIVAKLIVLTEGASPKIGIAANIRPDFEPEDLLHFGRAIVPGVHLPASATGEWRTSWNMPAWYSAIPHPDGAIVGASARIENIMRVGRDGREVLRDLLQSPIAATLGLPDSIPDLGMELVPLRANSKVAPLGTHRMVISPDANGTIDPRSMDRYAAVITAGAGLGAYIAAEWPDTTDWDDAGGNLATMFTVQRTPYHDSSKTGFIEDGAGKPHGLLRKLIGR